MEYKLNDDEIMGSERTFLKRRENGLMLSDKDIEILSNAHINYLNCHSLEELIFVISERLEEENDENLELLNIRLGEYNYYYYTNK